MAVVSLEMDLITLYGRLGISYIEMTEEEINAKIAQLRADVVKNSLVSKYKISSDRIAAKGMGVGDVFSEPDWNRVSICTLEETK